MPILQESTIQKVREHWFANHKATLRDYVDAEGNTITVIDWREPGTGVFAIRYILDRHYLSVTGDAGHAIYRLDEKAELKHLAHDSMEYMFSQLLCADDSGIEFDSDVAVESIRNTIKEFFENEDTSMYPAIEAAIEAANEAISHNDWQARLAVLDDKYNLNEYFGDWEWWLPDCGDVYSHQAVGCWIGLKMAYEQLEESKVLSVGQEQS